MAQQPLNNLDTFGVQRGKINANDAELYVNAAAALAAAVAAQATATAAIPAAQKGAASGVATLGGDTKVPQAQMTGKLALSDLTDGATQQAAITNSIKYAASWAADTNVVTGVAGLTSLSNANPGVQTAFQNTTAGTTAVAYLGAITSVNFKDEVLWNPLVGAWQLMPFNAPSVLGIFATTGALQTAFPAANWNGYSASVGSSVPYLSYTSNGTAWVQDITATQVGAANGAASLDGSAHLPAAQLPALTGDVTSSAGSAATTVASTAAALNQLPSNAQAGTTYTLVLTDAGLSVDMSNASANTITIPPNSSVAFPINTVINVTQVGAGTTTIAAGAGVTINKPSARTLSISAQYEGAWLRKTATDTWTAIVG